MPLRGLGKTSNTLAKGCGQCSLTARSPKRGALATKEGNWLCIPLGREEPVLSKPVGDEWLSSHQARPAIRRLTAQYPERNGREAELRGHPSRLAGPVMRHRGMGERKESCKTEEV